MITEFAKNKSELRDQIEQLTAEYIANGGKITKVKAGRKTIGVDIEKAIEEVK